MIKALETGQYYKKIENVKLYTDLKDNKKYLESDLASKWQDISIELSLVQVNMERLLKDNIFSNDYDNEQFNNLINKNTNDIIDFLEKNKQEAVNKYNNIISQYKDISIARKNLNDWIKTLQESTIVEDVICFRVDEIKILLNEKAENEEWEDNLLSDEAYRENGVLVNNIIDSTEYAFSYLEIHSEKIKDIEFENTSNFLEMTELEIAQFEQSLASEDDYFMSQENPNC